MDQLVGLNKNILSKVYEAWYRELFRLKNIPFPKNLEIHPHNVLRPDTYLNSDKIVKKIPISFVYEAPSFIETNIIYTNSSKLKCLKCRASTFDSFFASLPPISNGNMYLEIGNSPKLFLSNNEDFVIVKVKNLEEYVKNYFLLKSIIEESGITNLSVIPEIGFVKSKNDNYFISWFKGNDYEIEILLNKKDYLKKNLEKASKKANQLFIENGLFIRNLAPRNLIYSKNKTFIIDYDNIYELQVQNYQKIWELQITRRVWFGDIFEPNLINKLFQKLDFKIELSKVVKADYFEEKFFCKKQITLKERKTLFKLTAMLERKSNYCGINIFGHQLGRFISDFWEETSEVSLLKYLSNHTNNLEKIRLILFIPSRIDQELLFYQNYEEHLDKTIVSEQILKKIISMGTDLNFAKVIKKYKLTNTFEEKYKLFKELL